MGKFKSILICLLAIACPFVAGSGTAGGDVLRSVALVGATTLTDVSVWESTSDSPNLPDLPDMSSPSDLSELPSESEDTSSGANSAASTSDKPDNSGDTSNSSTSSISSTSSTSSTPTSSSEDLPVNNPLTPAEQQGTVITLNRSAYTDDTDFSQFTTHSGKIIRYNFGRFTSEAYINLESGAQVRNCTNVLNSVLEETSTQLPQLDIDVSKPSVLIYHTHTTESFLPSADWYDNEYPLRSDDPSRSIVAVGDAVCAALASKGISVIHDCTVHDTPYTGAYNRSADTIARILEEYPSVKLVIDIHRDGIASGEGYLPAPVAEIDGRNAAQIMIISGCENEYIPMPDYLENFKLACLIQNTAEAAYPALTRPVLFDYRHYNQSMSTGALLIEVGSHGNSLDEAVYSGELVGYALADVVHRLAHTATP